MSNITRRDPLDDFFRGFFVRPVEYGGGPAANVEAPQMRVDVKEQDDAYQVHAELPGIKKEDIHVGVDGNQVSISAEVKNEKDVKEGSKVLRNERYYGSVSRAFPWRRKQVPATFITAQYATPMKSASKLMNGALIS